MLPGLLQLSRNTPLSNCSQQGLPGWASSRKQGLKFNSLQKKAFSTLLSVFFYSAVNYYQLDFSLARCLNPEKFSSNNQLLFNNLHYPFLLNFN